MTRNTMCAPGVLLGIALLGGCPSPTQDHAQTPGKEPSETNSGSSCECTQYPFKARCDSECGIATAVVESVHKDSAVVRVPIEGAKGEAPAFERRTISLRDLKPEQVQGLKPGSRVEFTFRKVENGQAVMKMKSVRAIRLPPQ